MESAWLLDAHCSRIASEQVSRNHDGQLVKHRWDNSPKPYASITSMDKHCIRRFNVNLFPVRIVLYRWIIKTSSWASNQQLIQLLTLTNHLLLKLSSRGPCSYCPVNKITNRMSLQSNVVERLLCFTTLSILFSIRILLRRRSQMVLWTYSSFNCSAHNSNPISPSSFQLISLQQHSHSKPTTESRVMPPILWATTTKRINHPDQSSGRMNKRNWMV